MKKCLFISAVGLALSAAPVFAQANACPMGGDPGTAAGAQANVTRDGCLQAVDVFQFIAPQLGLALTGGNATMGQGGTLGGLGHFTIGVRGNVFRGDLPKVNDFPAPRNEQGPPAQTLPSRNQILGLPTADAAIGIFRGVPLGITNVGGLDVLVSASYIPSVGGVGDGVQIKPHSNTKFGFGARLGLLQESIVTPGVSVTYFRRDLPATDIVGTSDQVDVLIRDADIKTSAWRLVASKSFIMFGLAGGIGQDHYDESATMTGTVHDQTITVGGIPVATGEQTFSFPFVQKNTRTNAFLDLSVNMPFFKIVAEGGQVSGGDVTTYNTFTSGSVNDSRLYGSLGLRFVW